MSLSSSEHFRSDWNNYFKNAFFICCKVVNWEYQFRVKPPIPNYFEYENSVLDHLDALMKARLEEHQEDKEDMKKIERATKILAESIRKGNTELTKTIEESYNELKQLFKLSQLLPQPI